MQDELILRTEGAINKIIKFMIMVLVCWFGDLFCFFTERNLLECF